MSKKIALYVAVMLLFAVSNAACAENERSENVFFDAALQIEQWNSKLVSMTETLEDENSQYLLATVINFHDVALAVFMDVANSASPLEGQAGDYKFSAPYQGTEDNYWETGTRHIEGVEYYFEHRIMYFENYICTEMDIYRQDGTYLGSQKLEMGEKDGQLMLLFVDYDPITDMTGRFAMLPSGNNGNTIFTKTFGRTWDVTLNIRQWLAEDQDISWNKTLLYSTN